jgi:RNA polymerase sigma-70 factor (ECF subfamily)
LGEAALRSGAAAAWRTPAPRPASPTPEDEIEDLPAGLIERVRKGQPEARAELFRRYAPQAREILFLQGMCEDLDDAVQEVFVKVFRATLPAEERFLSWLYTVILNTGRDLGRRRKSRLGLQRRLEEAMPATPATPAIESEQGDPAVKKALRELPAEFREVVALRFYADLALDDIARCQGVPVGTVKSRLHSALSRLRTALIETGTRSG